MPDVQTIVSVTPEEREKAHENAVSKLEDKQTLERGRPTVITPNRVVLLVAAFQNGLNTRTACVYAGISKDAFYKRYKEDAEFADTIDLAKNNLITAAGTAINEIISDKDNRDRGKMARWLFEKKIPEEYGQKNLPSGNNNIQNNFILLNNEQISNIGQQPDIDEADPTELFEALEEASKLDVGKEEESTS